MTFLGLVRKRQPYHPMDLGIAVEHFCLQAVEEWLGNAISLGCPQALDPAKQ